jgi:hypothetical protein
MVLCINILLLSSCNGYRTVTHEHSNKEIIYESYMLPIIMLVLILA